MQESDKTQAQRLEPGLRQQLLEKIDPGLKVRGLGSWGKLLFLGVCQSSSNNRDGIFVMYEFEEDKNGCCYLVYWWKRLRKYF